MKPEDTGDSGVESEPIKPKLGDHAMLFLSESLLNAAGFHFDRIQDTWVAPVRLAPVVTVECDEDGSYVMEALLEVHAALEDCGCTYANFAVQDGYLSLVGLSRAMAAAVA